MTQPLSLALSGCGKMGAAMVRGWRAQNLYKSLFVRDPGGLPPDLQNDQKILVCESDEEFKSQLKTADMLILAVKPQIMPDICAALADRLPSNLPVLSIAAGQSLSNFAAYFGSRHPVIRAMPNTPAAIGKGMTVACPNAMINNHHKTMADSLLRPLGPLEWIADESLMDAVTAVSGSGPAYVFYLIEALADAGKQAGLPEALAMTLARQTVVGAAALADKESTTPASTLRENVTSPNGTTAAALEILMDGRMKDIMKDAVAKATARSRELAG